MERQTYSLKLEGWKAVLVLFIIAGFVIFKSFSFNRVPPEKVKALKSGNIVSIFNVVYDAGKLKNAESYALIPFMLPLLKDTRPLPLEMEAKIIRDIQASPGAIGGMEDYLKGNFTVGFAAALCLENLIIGDMNHFGGRSARKHIVDYVLGPIGSSADVDVLKNGLVAVVHIQDSRLLPFWFRCLNDSSDDIKSFALSGLYFYAFDRNHGFVKWHPEKEMSAEMFSAINRCLNSSSSLVRSYAQMLKKEIGN